MRRIHRDLTLVGLSHLVSAGCLIGIQVFLARHLNPHVFGIFILYQTISNIAESVIIARSGEVALYTLGRISTKNIFEKEVLSGYSRYLRTRELVWNILVYAALLIIPLALDFTNIINIDLLLWALIGLTIPLQTTYGVSKALLVISGDIHLQSKFEIFYSLSLFLAVAFMGLMFGVYGAALAYATMSLVKTVVAYNITRKIYGHKEINVKHIRPPHKNLSIHAVIRNISKNIATQGDLVVLGAFAGPSSVAVYKIARSLANLSIRLSDPLWTVLRPRFLEGVRNLQIESLRQLIVTPAICFALLGYACVLPLMYLYAEPLIVLVYGESYIASTYPFIILFTGTWLYSAVTGWLNFFIIISSNKVIGSFMSGLLALSGLAGAYLTKGDINLLAIWISASFMVASLIAWFLAFKTKYLIR